jgi:hypothetical protein
MVNEYYLNDINRVRAVFLEEGVVELKQFLEDDEISDLKKQVLNLKLMRDVVITSHAYSKTDIVLRGSTNKMMSAMNSYVHKIAGATPKSWEVWSFGSKDYTVINDEKLEKPGIDLILDITPDWKAEWGGSAFYVDGSGEFTMIKPEENKLLIFRRSAGTHRFIQYVNHLAQKKRKVFLIARI